MGKIMQTKQGRPKCAAFCQPESKFEHLQQNMQMQKVTKRNGKIQQKKKEKVRGALKEAVKMTQTKVLIKKKNISETVQKREKMYFGINSKAEKHKRKQEKGEHCPLSAKHYG